MCAISPQRRWWLAWQTRGNRHTASTESVTTGCQLRVRAISRGSRGVSPSRAASACLLGVSPHTGSVCTVTGRVDGGEVIVVGKSSSRFYGDARCVYLFVRPFGLGRASLQVYYK